MGLGSGDRREDDAQSAGVSLGDLWAVLAEGLLAALRDAIKSVLFGSVSPAMAALTLRRHVAALFAETRARSTTILTEQTSMALGNLHSELQADFPAARPAITPGMVRQIIPGVERQLASVQLQAERAIHDAYQRAVGNVMTPRPGISEAQRLTNAQKVLDELADHGITGFTDRAGRQWELVSYVEMATRTAVSRSLLNLELSAYTALGHDAVLVVSRTLDAPCPRCRPYDGKVLSISGATLGRDITVTPHDQPQRTDHVTATLPDAIARGLLHPNCRHALIPFIDGQAMTPAGLQPPPAAVYDAEQRQRALERRIRVHRRRVAAALPGQRASARRHLAAATTASREHAAAHGIKRRTRRERLDVPR